MCSSFCSRSDSDPVTSSNDLQMQDITGCLTDTISTVIYAILKPKTDNHAKDELLYTQHSGILNNQQFLSSFYVLQTYP